jgi:hypothetical protein
MPCSRRAPQGSPGSSAGAAERLTFSTQRGRSERSGPCRLVMQSVPSPSAMLRLLTSFLASLVVASSIAFAGDPAETVSAVVKLDGQRSSLFSYGDQPTPLMLKYFTADFIATWVAAMRHNKEGPVLDGDPLTWLQGVKSLTLKGTQTNLIASDHATVTARVVAQPSGSTFTKPEGLILLFDVRRENTIWKINDIGNPTEKSVQTYLSRFK